MIYKHNFTLPEELAAEIADQGFEFLPELLRLVINAAMQMERQKYLGVEHLLVSIDSHSSLSVH